MRGYLENMPQYETNFLNKNRKLVALGTPRVSQTIDWDDRSQLAETKRNEMNQFNRKLKLAKQMKWETYRKIKQEYIEKYNTTVENNERAGKMRHVLLTFLNLKRYLERTRQLIHEERV